VQINPAHFSYIGEKNRKMGKVIWLNRTKPVETGIKTKEYNDL